MSSAHQLSLIQQKISKGEWRADVRSSNWAGKAEVLGLSTDTEGARKHISEMLNTWVKNKAFKIVSREDKYRNMREFVEVGQVASE
jgi:hypothetical protein